MLACVRVRAGCVCLDTPEGVRVCGGGPVGLCVRVYACVGCGGGLTGGLV